MATRRVLLAMLLAAIATTGFTARGQQPALVLSNVTIIDGSGAPPRPGVTLEIVDGRIAGVHAAEGYTPPAGATVLDVAGKFVMPGLIDAHVHLAAVDRPPAVVAALLRAALLGGVTTVRDMGGNGRVVAELAEAAARAGAESPAIHAAAVFAGPAAFWFNDPRAVYLNDGPASTRNPWLVRVDADTNLREAVRRAKAWGATGVKLHSFLTARQMRTIADEARRQRMAVWSRGTVGPATPRDAVDARALSMSHAESLVWEGRTGVAAPLFGLPAGLTAAMAAVPPDDRAVRELLQDMRGRGVMLEPLLFIGVQAASFAGPDERPAIDAHVAWGAAVTTLGNEMGVSIVAGTDALGGSSPNIHAELQLLVNRAGLTPLQALRAATFNAARAIGVADRIGSIAAGRQADLVVLDANPAEDIRNTQTVLFVLRNGVVHRRVEPMPSPPFAEPPPGRPGG